MQTNNEINLTKQKTNKKRIKIIIIYQMLYCIGMYEYLRMIMHEFVFNVLASNDKDKKYVYDAIINCN